ncbi:hypothetical protein [Lysinibacillus sp. 38-6]|uniref:hypothetical protein n=1 Tax=Lysinibacillus sp. 38-6 TaxID=3385991 RepID=UPI00390897A6
MLNNFLEKGLEIGLFDIKPLRELDTNRRINSDVEVIDFDNVKDSLFKKLNENNTFSLELTKSCDALKIIPLENRLDFIEIKGIEIFCERNAHLTGVEIETAIEKQLLRFDLQNKIDHSLFIIQLLIQINQMGLDGKQRASFFNQILSEYIVVIDSHIENNGILEISAMLEFWAETSNIKDEFIIKLKEEMGKVSVLKIREPRLMFQSELDGFYAENIKIDQSFLQKTIDE